MTLVVTFIDGSESTLECSVASYEARYVILYDSQGRAIVRIPYDNVKILKEIR